MASGAESEREKPGEGFLPEHQSSAPLHGTTEHRLHAAGHVRSLMLTGAFGLLRPVAVPLTSLPCSATRHIMFQILPLPKLPSLYFSQLPGPSVLPPAPTPSPFRLQTPHPLSCSHPGLLTTSRGNCILKEACYDLCFLFCNPGLVSL